ncbi:4-diphosphocytidyl-2C-methyl-D-erythritol kinase [Kordiimonas sediminis]|uniref:4-diphosphocytidyl-2C-methyl-D-erythritol kinase n=1 Tax=Kordiimonas sediminis TaxID=1735581 RepID=A0A919E956_9PROT|nr:NTP transferase domain-containing protein [Kordiimonas sediminis]GHF25294.1 4-diphosphocytidyl-2C-methyl-D-erythritol kinase [Kordiimonas sediminis]
MQFETRDIQSAIGWYLAHSIAGASTRYGKGTEITLEIVNDVTSNSDNISNTINILVSVFKPEKDDIDENTAAANLARAIASDTGTVHIPDAARGRVDLYASTNGLLDLGNSFDAFNQVHEACTVAALPTMTPVRKGQKIATIKIIPFTVHKDIIEQLQSLPPAITVHPFTPFKAAMIDTHISASPKTRRVTENRLQSFEGTLHKHVTCTHTQEEIASNIEAYSRDPDIDCILIAGRAAIADRRDDIPAALISAGGTVEYLGMPVDPGNLLMLGHLGKKLVIGLPGCARSPAPNGADILLARFAAKLKTTGADIQKMGRGGLLNGALTYYADFSAKSQDTNADNNTAAIILAAGQSSRAQGRNKLLGKIGSETVIRKTTDLYKAIVTSTPIIVLGHDADHIIQTVGNNGIRTIHNPDHTSGMASSIRAGIQAIPDTAELVFIALGDMPFVHKETIQQLITAAQDNPDDGIFIPTLGKKRGNPVLWRRPILSLFENLAGDTGGRQIIHANEHLVREVPVHDPAILIDLDTPERLDEYGIE